MACRGFWECLLKLLNFVMSLAGLAMVGYGFYLYVIYNEQSPSSDPPAAPPLASDETFVPLLLPVSLSNDIFDNLPTAWFIYLFIGVGVVLFLISCCGCIGATARNVCCLTTYAVFLVLLILLELGCAALFILDKSWLDKIPKDKTGHFDMMYDFLEEHWAIAKLVILGIVGLEAVLFLLTVIVREANSPDDDDSDEEFINPRQSTKQPFLNRQSLPTSVPASGAIDKRPTRNDPWSARVKDKFVR